jgi:AmpD protein
MQTRQARTPQRSGFAIDVATGWLAGARRLESPNCDDRPSGVVADLIVVHGISLPPGEFGGPWIDALFTNHLPVDEHPYFVQYVPFHRRAWHAGQSSWMGRERCNDFSIGIELEGTDSSAYESAQYVSLSRLVAALCGAYRSLSTERIVGHSDIAPGRKSDPGIAFDWPLLRALARYELEVAPA